MRPAARTQLNQGVVIPACPLALNAARKFDERRQRALLRYYAAAGAGGVAVGVHTTQFTIREARHGLFQPLLSLAAEELKRAETQQNRPLIRVGGVCGNTFQATEEAKLLKQLGYDAGLLSLAAMKEANNRQMVDHCRAVASVLPVIGFYLQPAVGGRVLSISFWRQFLEIENVVAIKIAPFNRYQTLDVVRAVVEVGRADVALYTGNDDNILLDLLTPFAFSNQGKPVTRRIVGGLLGHWSVWTRRAVEQLEECHRVVASGGGIPPALLRQAAAVTDANAAFFDAANGFAGCIGGLHEVLRRQGLLAGTWCLDPAEGLSLGQSEEIDRVYQAYPELNDDQFVAGHLEKWLR